MQIEKLSSALDATSTPTRQLRSTAPDTEARRDPPKVQCGGATAVTCCSVTSTTTVGCVNTPGSGVTVEAEPVNRHNGLTRDQQGRLIAAEHDGRRVSRLEHDGSTTVLANQFQGRQLNLPNDVVVKSDGSIYFTDPWTFRRPREQWEQTISGVYRISPDLGTLTLLVSDFVVPNGLAFNPDETVLYINDSRRASSARSTCRTTAA